MRKSNLFRKNSLKKVSSPEQLDEYVKIINPNLILLIVAILSILFSGFVWICNSDIPRTQKIPGIVITERGVQKLYSYVDIGTSIKLKEGMPTKISPNYLPAENYGYINGEIEKVGNQIIDSDYIFRKFENPNLISSIYPTNNCVEVIASFKSPSSEKIADIKIIDGSQCTSSVILGKERAIDFILNR